MNPIQQRLQQIQQQISSYWLNLTRREQLLLGIGIVLTVLWLLWQFLFVTLTDQRQQAESAVHASWEQLKQTHFQTSQIRQLQAAGAAASMSSNQPINSLIHSTAGRFGLSVERAEVNGDQITVAMEGVRFDNVMRLLSELEIRHRIVVKQMRLRAGSTDGLVNVEEIQFERQ